jgi:putative hydrolase of HD superfamily
MNFEHLLQQVAFIHEIDKIKYIQRKTRLFNSDRNENDAEHSWHLSVMAIVLAQHSNKSVDILKVVKMLLIHDVVEIDAGDIFLYDTVLNHDNTEAERKAAERIFGLLPAEQAAGLIAIWEEFESGETPEAKFARSMDRLEPLLQNVSNNGGTWKEYNVRYDQVVEKKSIIKQGSQTLWNFAKTLIDESVEKGFLKKRIEEPGQTTQEQGLNITTINFEHLLPQVAFIHEIDKIKYIQRKSRLFNSNRNENDAEHSWHLAVMAIVLAQHSNNPIDILKVVKMLLIHDVVEIDAGDIFLYDTVLNHDNAEAERKAAERIFGLLPAEQAAGLIAIWEEFEIGETPEAKFARSMDRLEPLLQNVSNNGGAWREYNVKYEQVIQKNGVIQYGSQTLWDFAKTLVDNIAEKGF